MTPPDMVLVFDLNLSLLKAQLVLFFKRLCLIKFSSALVLDPNDKSLSLFFYKSMAISFFAWQSFKKYLKLSTPC